LDVCSSPKIFQQGENVKFSVKSLVIAAALLTLCFLFVSLLNLILPPFGGAFLALLTSLYVGYDPMAGLISVLVGTLYSLIAGAVAGALFGWLYNSFVERF
jgi:ABC-type phosphate transport system permease subunit